MAGTDAGFAYPTWPMMGETFVPMGYYAEGWQATFEGVATIHFNHRMLAYAMALLGAGAERAVSAIQRSSRRQAGCLA